LNVKTIDKNQAEILVPHNQKKWRLGTCFHASFLNLDFLNNSYKEHNKRLEFYFSSLADNSAFFNDNTVVDVDDLGKIVNDTSCYKETTQNY